MQAVIGEIFSSYRKTDNGLYTHSFTGTGMDFPELFLITALSDDAAGHAMKEMLGSSGRRMEIIPSMLHSAFIAGDDVLLKLSAPSGIRTEDLVDVLSRHPEIDGAVLSAPLLSVNPSADAIADAGESLCRCNSRRRLLRSGHKADCDLYRFRRIWWGDI